MFWVQLRWQRGRCLIYGCCVSTGEMGFGEAGASGDLLRVQLPLVVVAKPAIIDIECCSVSRWKNGSHDRPVTPSCGLGREVF